MTRTPSSNQPLRGDTTHKIRNSILRSMHGRDSDMDRKIEATFSLWNDGRSWNSDENTMDLIISDPENGPFSMLSEAAEQVAEALGMVYAKGAHIDKLTIEQIQENPNKYFLDVESLDDVKGTDRLVKMAAAGGAILPIDSALNKSPGIQNVALGCADGRRINDISLDQAYMPMIGILPDGQDISRIPTRLSNRFSIIETRARVAGTWADHDTESEVSNKDAPEPPETTSKNTFAKKMSSQFARQVAAKRAKKESQGGPGNNRHPKQ